MNMPKVAIKDNSNLWIYQTHILISKAIIDKLLLVTVEFIFY